MSGAQQRPTSPSFSVRSSRHMMSAAGNIPSGHAPMATLSSTVSGPASDNAAAPTSAQASGSLAFCHQDLRRSLYLHHAQERKLYMEGYLSRRDDASADGKPLRATDPRKSWTLCFVQLAGTVLAAWSVRALEQASKENQKVPPSYINITDAFVDYVGALTEDPEQVPNSKGQYENVFSLNTAGANRSYYCVEGPVGRRLVQAWVNAIRLASWERMRLEEMYTGSLFRALLSHPSASVRRDPRRGSVLWDPSYTGDLTLSNSSTFLDDTDNVPPQPGDPADYDQRALRTPLVKGRLEGSVRARFMGSTEWRNAWLVLADSPQEALPEPSAKKFWKIGSSGNRGSILSLGGGNQSSGGTDFGPNAGPGASGGVNPFDGIAPPAGMNPTRGVAYFYESKKAYTSGAAPFATVIYVAHVYAVYPSRPELVEGSSLFKLEAVLSSPPDNRPVLSASGVPRQSGWIMLMPQTDTHSGMTGNKEMIKWLLGFIDAFHLYGRPTSLDFDPRNPVSAFFAYPIGQYKDRLFLDRELAEYLKVKEESHLVHRTNLHSIMAMRMHGQDTPLLTALPQPNKSATAVLNAGKGMVTTGFFAGSAAAAAAQQRAIAEQMQRQAQAQAEAEAQAQAQAQANAQVHVQAQARAQAEAEAEAQAEAQAHAEAQAQASQTRNQALTHDQADVSNQGQHRGSSKAAGPQVFADQSQGDYASNYQQLNAQASSTSAPDQEWPSDTAQRDKTEFELPQLTSDFGSLKMSGMSNEAPTSPNARHAPEHVFGSKSPGMAAFSSDDVGYSSPWATHHQQRSSNYASPTPGQGYPEQVNKPSYPTQPYESSERQVYDSSPQGMHSSQQWQSPAPPVSNALSVETAPLSFPQGYPTHAPGASPTGQQQGHLTTPQNLTRTRGETSPLAPSPIGSQGVESIGQPFAGSNITHTSGDNYPHPGLEPAQGSAGTPARNRGAFSPTSVHSPGADAASQPTNALPPAFGPSGRGGGVGDSAPDSQGASTGKEVAQSSGVPPTETGIGDFDEGILYYMRTMPEQTPAPAPEQPASAKSAPSVAPLRISSKPNSMQASRDGPSPATLQSPASASAWQGEAPSSIAQIPRATSTTAAGGMNDDLLAAANFLDRPPSPPVNTVSTARSSPYFGVDSRVDTPTSAHADQQDESLPVPQPAPQAAAPARTSPQPPNSALPAPAKVGTFPSSFKSNKRAQERKVAAAQQAEAHQAALHAPGKKGGERKSPFASRPRASDPWGSDSSDDEEAEEDNDEEDDDDGEEEPGPNMMRQPSQPENNAAGIAQRPSPSGYSSSPVPGQEAPNISSWGPDSTGMQAYASAPGVYGVPQPPYAYSPGGGSSPYARSQSASPAGGQGVAGPSTRQLQQQTANRQPYGGARSSVFNTLLSAPHNDPQASMQPPSSPQMNGGSLSGAYPGMVSGKAASSTGPTGTAKSNTFVDLGDDAPGNMTALFQPHGLLQAGAAEKAERSAKAQEAEARKEGVSLVSVPNQPPPPQAGLLGAISAHERDRKAAGGLGATMTERERERIAMEKRHRKDEEENRASGAMTPGQWGGGGSPGMMGMPPMMGGYMPNPYMMWGGMMPGMMPPSAPGSAMGGGGGSPQQQQQMYMMQMQQQMHAMQAAQMAYAQAMSQAPSHAGGGSPSPGSVAPGMGVMPPAAGANMSPGFNPYMSMMPGMYNPMTGFMPPGMGSDMGANPIPRPRTGSGARQSPLRR